MIIVSGLARLWPTLALAAIVVVGLALRWDRLDYAEFTADQAWVINRAYDFVTRGDFPLAGIHSSVGTAQGPMEIYLLAIPVAFSKDPRVATAFVGLLQVLAIVGTYLLTAKYFGRTAGLIAAALFAVNPWALQYARKMWTPNMMPLFTVLFFAALYAGVAERRRYALAFACLWLVVLFLIHPAAFVYAPLLLLVVVLFWRRIGWRPLLLGVLLGAVAAAPFLYYEYLHGFHSLRQYAGVSATASRIDLEALKLIETMASARYFPMMMGYGFRGEWTLPGMQIQNHVATWLMYLGLAFCVWQLAVAWRGRGGPAARGWEPYALLLLWFCVPILASVRHSVEFYPHYFVLIYPLQFVLIAVGLTHAGDLVARTMRGREVRQLWPVTAAVAAVVLYLGWSQIAYFRTYLDYVERNGPLGPYGVPLLFSERAVDNVRALHGELGYTPVYVYSYLQHQALDYLARPDLELRQIEPPQGLVLPRDSARGALLMLASDDIGGWHRSFRLVHEDGPMVGRLHDLGFVDLADRAVVAPDGHVYYRFFSLPPGRSGDIVASFERPLQPPSLANGMRLLGYSYPQTTAGGETVTLSLLWQMPDASPRYKWREHNLFAHLVDGSGRSFSQQDWEVYQYMAWRADDLLISHHELEVPPDRGPGLVWIDLGAYLRADRSDVGWVDGDGKVTGTATKLGPLKIRPPAESRLPAVQTEFLFGGALELAGYDLAPREAAAGRLEVVLHWRVRAGVEAEYTVSVQVLDPGGNLVAQHDSPPVEGDYPTSYWEAGETVVDRHALTLPGGGEAGTYSLIVAVYGAETLARMPVTLPNGTSVGDHANLGSLAGAGGEGR